MPEFYLVCIHRNGKKKERKNIHACMIEVRLRLGQACIMRLTQVKRVTMHNIPRLY